MTPQQDILEHIQYEWRLFQDLKKEASVVENSIPILWFGNVEQYFVSEKKIITVSLNPSDKEFKGTEEGPYSPEYRFPSYNEGDIKSLYQAYNEYFHKSPYDQWFKSSFDAVLKGFDASFYEDRDHVALHTDIASPYATNPTWSGLNEEEKERLEAEGSRSWHELVKVLEPDVILFSASRGHEEKIRFQALQDWKERSTKDGAPLKMGEFRINEKKSKVLFQVQGRKPFLQSNGEEKVNFAQYLHETL